jgi:hypothetical protein
MSSSWYRYIGGQFWVGGWYWGSPSYVSFFRQVCGLQLDEKIEQAAKAYTDTVESACWWWPYKDFVMVCERPQMINMDAGRLHNASGPSISWSDGWALYHWHGVRVTERLIMRPEEYTAEEIKKETNSEVVRALAERLGWDRFLEKIGVLSKDKWVDSTTGLQYELLEAQHHFNESQGKWLRMTSPMLQDGSQPNYLEPVPAGIKTAQAARRWQIANPDGTEPSVEECNTNPKLVFATEA